ncbi:MAG: hypothetical protein ABI852_07550 [Gemmatimonadaceae bacterium]
MIRSNSRRLITSVALLLTVGSIATAQHVFADISGKWIVSNDSPAGHHDSPTVFKQEGETLTGTIEIPQIGSAKLTGTVKGDSVKYSFQINVEGNPIDVTASGVVKDKDNMAGTIYLPADLGNFPFTAKRQP